MEDKSFSIVFDRRAVDWLRAVVSVTAKDRQPIDCVHVSAGGSLWSPVLGDFDGVSLTATDSYRLLTVALPLDVAGLVEVSGYCDSLVLPLRDVKLPAGGRVAICSGVGQYDQVPGQVTVEIEDRQGRETVQALRYDPAAHFPNWQQLIPSFESFDGFPVTALNGEMVGPLFTAMAKAGGGVDSPIRFVGGVDDMKPVRFDCVGDFFAASAIAMPVRVPGGVLGHLERFESVERVAVSS